MHRKTMHCGPRLDVSHREISVLDDDWVGFTPHEVHESTGFKFHFHCLCVQFTGAMWLMLLLFRRKKFRRYGS